MTPRRIAAAPPLPATLPVIAARGDRRHTLEALRAVVADAIDRCEEPRDLAALAGRLQAVLVELDAIPEAKEVDPVADIAARAARRRATAAR